MDTEELILPTNIAIDIPENQFERVAYLQNLIRNLQKIQESASKFVETELERLSHENDPEYEVVPVFDNRKSTIIKAGKLRDEQPELYEKALSISTANAAKILGEDMLFKICEEYGGRERTLALSSLTLKNLKKILTPEEFKRYTYEIYKQRGLMVSKKEESHD